jgi:eukaryotic-like serine/threonine-protein kinase
MSTPVGMRVSGRYRLDARIGHGGMSTVYRGFDEVLERTVAVKVMDRGVASDSDQLERFRREARAVAQLNHPHIVTVIDAGEDDQMAYIVFEYVEGENLKRVIEREGPVPVERALELGVQIARGLVCAHERGLVHRDVKPQNVLLNGDGEAKVTDFGIVRQIEVAHGMTETGTVLGTSDYISPEQAQGRRVDEQTDVYSLGVVLYELLTGEVPFSGESFVAVALKHVNEAPPDLRERRPDVPPRVAAAIGRALAKEPSDRWPSMAAFGRELEACLDEDEEGTATVVLPPAQQPRRPYRTPALLVAVGLCLLGVLGGILLVRGADHGGPAPAAVAAITNPVALRGVGAYDPPPGDGQEHDAAAPLATDGNPATYWETSRYRYPDGGLGKPGVGLVLDAGNAVTLHRLVIDTDTPGFAATIRAGDARDGPFHDVSGSQTVGSSTTFDLSGGPARYYVVWITNLGRWHQVHVNEVVAG